MTAVSFASLVSRHPSPKLLAPSQRSRPVSFRLPFLAILALLLASPAAASEVTFPNPTDPVPGHDKLSHLDLLRMVVPDLALDGVAYQGHMAGEVRHIGGPDALAAAPETVALGVVSSMPLLVDGRQRTALVIDLGHSEDDVASYTILALFDLTAGPKLLDAANIGYDASTWFRDDGKIALSSGQDLILTKSTHSNSSQGYVTSAMILPIADRLTLIDTVFTFDEKTCATERVQWPTFRSFQENGPYSDIEVAVTDETKATGEACEGGTPELSTGYVAVTYGWDAAAGRYVASSGALKALAEESRQRF